MSTEVYTWTLSKAIAGKFQEPNDDEKEGRDDYPPPYGGLGESLRHTFGWGTQRLVHMRNQISCLRDHQARSYEKLTNAGRFAVFSPDQMSDSLSQVEFLRWTKSGRMFSRDGSLFFLKFSNALVRYGQIAMQTFGLWAFTRIVSSFLFNHLRPSCFLVFPVVRAVLW